MPDIERLSDFSPELIRFPLRTVLIDFALQAIAILLRRDALGSNI